MRASRAFLTVTAAVLASTVLASCVFPTPPPGDPVPSLTLTALDEGAGVVTVTATPANFTPGEVQFRLDSGSTPIAVDRSAPFTVTLYTAEHRAGAHTVHALGIGGGYLVGESLPVQLRQPNFVFVLLDDLDEWASPYWDAMPQTRALLADRGLSFANAFVVDPLCCPSRATFLTGRYPHNTGVFSNTPPDGGYQQFRDGGAQNDTVATRLRAAGYRTGFVGKYLNGYPSDPTAVPPGWDEWFGLVGFIWFAYGYKANHNGTVLEYGSAESDYQTDVLADVAVDFVEGSEANDAQPFFLTVQPVAPHTFIEPAPRHANHPFVNAPLPTRPNTNEADVSDKPTWLRDGYPVLTQAEIDTLTADYRRAMGSLLAVDDLVADVAAALDANGELDDTVFVFSSDNGMNWGAHRHRGKEVPYEESLGVPFVVAGPGVRTGTESALVTNADFAPTVLHLAGLGEPADLDGRSLVPLLRATGAPWRSNFLVELNGTDDENLHTYADVLTTLSQQGRLVRTPTYRALRTTKYLYVEWYDGTPHEYELYDLRYDPYQLDNLLATPAGQSAYATIRQTLQARLDALKACTGAACR
ncbi:MAG: hypothetical protein KatS3mg009_1779 [Acidimicrobiia bacterium]|nr:MAG: hypothetical protein KatS3mg009_1779 [Acidimicrobiia bacterium]